jgi:hypothetical protein
MYIHVRSVNPSMYHLHVLESQIITLVISIPYNIENLNDPVTRIQSRWRMNGRAKVIIGNSDTMNAEHTLIYNNNLVKQYSDIASRRLTAMYHILYLQSVPSPNPAWFRIFVTFFPV